MPVLGVRASPVLLFFPDVLSGVLFRFAIFTVEGYFVLTSGPELEYRWGYEGVSPTA